MMKGLNKSHLIFVLLFIVILITCILPVILHEDAAISVTSAPAIIFGICSSVYAVIAFVNKEHGNLFVLGNNKLFVSLLRLLNDDNSNTDSVEYKKEFALSAFIFCASIPIYIPLAFFAENLYTALSSALLVTILRIINIFVWVLLRRVIKNAQEKKQDRIKDEADKKEQERRESMGEWR